MRGKTSFETAGAGAATSFPGTRSTLPQLRGEGSPTRRRSDVNRDTWPRRADVRRIIIFNSTFRPRDDIT